MTLSKKIELLLFPCQRRLDAMTAEYHRALDQLTDTIKEGKKNIVKGGADEIRSIGKIQR